MARLAKKLDQAKEAALKHLAFEGYRNPLTWTSQASGLYRSAQLLWKKSSKAKRIEKNPLTKRLWALTELRLDHYQRSALLLIGLAIENLAKGIVIGRAPEAEQERMLERVARGHDIEEVLGLLGPDKPSVSRDLTSGLQRHVEWASKYPVPKRPDRFEVDLTSHDFSEAEKLYKALMAIALSDSKEELVAWAGVEAGQSEHG